MAARPESKRQKKLRALLDAAIDLAAERGAATSLTEIAARAGVCRQTIYTRFGGKAGLLAAATAVERSPGFPLCEPAGEAPPDEVLVRYAIALLRWVWEPAQAARLRAMSRGLADDPSDAAAPPAMAGEALAAFLRAETGRGRLSIAAPDEAARLFLELVIAAPQLRVIAGEATTPAEDLHERARRCVRLFLRGCARDAPPPCGSASRTRPHLRQRSHAYETET